MTHQSCSNISKPISVGIIGGGTAGSTIAIRLAELGLTTHLFERKSSLISGPPMCHLHAGGNLYREIPDEDCLALLEQCVDILKLYPHTIDVRPTVFAVPTRDQGTPEDLLPRLDKLVQKYQNLIEQNLANKVLGEPEDYYRLYDRETVEHLQASDQVMYPQTLDEWMIPIAKKLDLNKVKFPLIMVNEFGWNIFRMSASASLALSDLPNAHVHTDTLVNNVTARHDEGDNKLIGWCVDFVQAGQQQTIEVDFLVNACGYRTGIIDDMAGVTVTRMVEFKASYVSYWSPKKMGGLMPELIIHGTRGTPHGMVQLTPYPDGHFQIHSMNQDVTLFPGGLADNRSSDATTASNQPNLLEDYQRYIDTDWRLDDDLDALTDRSQKAIDQVSEFVPSFASAQVISNALYGGQQIPGTDDTLRVADISVYLDKRYARAENVKASSALQASDVVVEALIDLGLVPQDNDIRRQHQWHYLDKYDSKDIDKLARATAKSRQFPVAMGEVNCKIDLQGSSAFDYA